MVRMNRRSQWLLFALGFVATANGMLLGVFLYALLAALLHVLSDHAPGVGWGLIAGGIGAAVLLGRSIARARQTRRLLYGESLLDYQLPEHARLVDRLGELTAKTALANRPSLQLVGGGLPNAYAVSRSQEEAAIVLTEGLLRRLAPAEQEAVIAHELAQIENDDVDTVGLADAVAVSIEELGRLKGRYFWGPREIAIELRWFFLVAIVGLILVSLGSHEQGSGALLVGLLAIAVVYGMWKTAVRSLPGILQLVLLILFIGPLTLAEWLLAPPTAYALARLVSRERVFEADWRAVELTGDLQATVSALRHLEGVEYSRGEAFWADIRFSLFVVPRAQGVYGAWRERVFSSHPPVAARIARLTKRAQERSRGRAGASPAADALKQSGEVKA